MKPIVFLSLIFLCGLAQAGESGYLVRATALKAKPFSDADTLATLPDQAKVEVLSRKFSWMLIKAEAGTGWVKMLSVRLSAPVTAPKSDEDGSLGKIFNLATTGKSGSTVTTGVRGLSEEQLKNATPNPEAFKILQGYAVNKEGAQNFAAVGQLKTEKVDYPNPPPSPASERGGAHEQ